MPASESPGSGTSCWASGLKMPGENEMFVMSSGISLKHIFLVD